VPDGHPPAAAPAGRSASTTDVDPGRHGADAIISYITQAITASNQPAHCGRALIRRSARASSFLGAHRSGAQMWSIWRAARTLGRGARALVRPGDADGCE